jgi:NAD(P)-dependent dehydrogenase (short-subunit alcohol dehydrogenase family)
VIVLAAATARGGTVELAQELGELGPVVILARDAAARSEGVTIVEADLWSPDASVEAWRSAEEANGPGEVLVTVPPPPAAPAPLAETSDEAWAALLRDSLFVAMHAARAAAPAMIGRGRGSIAMVTWDLEGTAGHVALAAACGAVGHFARTLASEIGGAGVTVNAVSVPAGRPADAAPAVRLLCSSDGGYLTSEALFPVGALP